MNLFTVFLVILFIGSSASASQDDLLKKTYVESPGTEISESLHFDPGAMNGMFSWQTILEDLFEPPVFMTEDGEFVPGAANKWYYSDDGMTLYIELNPDRAWSDGAPVTADDFVFALTRMRDPEFAFARAGFITDTIKGFDLDSKDPFGVSAPSMYMLKIEVNSPYAIDDSMLSEVAFTPLPRHKAPNESDTYWSKWDGGVTNGAYSLEEVKQDSILLRRNPYAPETRQPHFERVETTMRTWPEAVEAFLKGQVDYLYNIPERQMGWFDEQNIKTIVISSQVYYFALNQKHPRLGDRRVRRALRLAVDRQALVKQLYSGRAQPAYSIVPEGIQNYRPDPSLVPTDIQAVFAEAKALMEEVGYGPDNRLSLTISSNHSMHHVSLAEFVRAGWSQIYVDAELDMDETDFNAWFKRFTDGDYMVARRSWNGGKALMDAFMDVCKPLADPRCGHYDQPEYDEVMKAAYAEKDLTRRRELFREADRLITDADVLVPLFHGIIPVALSDRIDTSKFDGRIRRVRSFELRPSSR